MVCELETLQSIYPKELRITDHGVLADINEFIKNPMQELPRRLEYSIEIPLDNGSIELLISLSSNYPKEKPEVYARSSFLNRTQQLLLNQTLSDILEHQEENEPCIQVLVLWLQDNGENFLTNSNRNLNKELTPKHRKKDQKNSTDFTRYWIYSHHIYSKYKRNKIVDLAEENSLTGFCLAGKPGVICIEGAFEDCDYCWQKIKSMNWQKILLRLIEEEKDCKDMMDIMRKFKDFQEIFFTTSGRHNDMNQVLKYLIEHKSQHVFQELFDVEVKCTELAN
ncbi:RWD domain-containing protein 2A isoform X3 [Bombus huntii]|uniref:RWD domain-containing protein 2A isoform X3 n=1 Tax=Bombus huntii TaxID=85661 RepID=UPI0021A9784B|nr:RWD domain-containing protein 2A isoform X3 [Bombus huntii]